MKGFRVEQTLQDIDLLKCNNRDLNNHNFATKVSLKTWK